MAHAPPAGVLALHAVLASRRVDEQVRLPASELVEEELEHLHDGDVLKELRVEVQVGEALAGALLDGLGHKGHVLLHVAGEAVVAVVRVLPRKVGHHERRVHEPAHEVVEAAVHREGAVAALVRQNPHARQDQALDVAVDDPRGGAPELVLDLRNVRQGRVAQRKGQRVVAHDIAHGPRRRRLKAVGGNPAFDGVDVWELLLCWLGRQLLGLERDGS